jgi:hypothetical protein
MQDFTGAALGKAKIAAFHTKATHREWTSDVWAVAMILSSHV